MKNSWSLSELTHAICIMAHFHTLCSIVHGTGLEAALGELPVLQADMLEVGYNFFLKFRCAMAEWVEVCARIFSRVAMVQITFQSCSGVGCGLSNL